MQKKIFKSKKELLEKIHFILKKNKINFFLFNRTLLFAEKTSSFSPDKFDDIIIDKKKFKSKLKLFDELDSFFRIRYLGDILEINYKKNRLNIILIDFKKDYFYFNGVKILTKYFKKSKKVKIFQKNYFIFKNSNYICNRIFAPMKKDLFIRVFYSKESFFIKIKNLIISAIYLIIYENKMSNYEIKIRLDKIFNLSIYKCLNLIFKKFKIKKRKKLNEKEFKKLYFDVNQFNWIFRKKHLDIITHNQKYVKVGDIINFIKKKNLSSLKKKTIETKTNVVFEEPILWNKKFWQTGNNFFLYPIIYGFKKDVLSYDKVNSYIKKKKKYQYYSKSYFENLIDMKEQEIKNFLKENPLPINNNRGFISGRHRVAAMIGRLVRKQKYIPFYIYNEN